MAYTNARNAVILLFIVMFFSRESLGSSYHYIRLGHTEDAATNTTAGIAMMGGGDDIDEAFRWLCEKGGGGDFLILRARGDNDYNAYVNGLCKTNSVATLIIPDRESAEDPAVADIIRSCRSHLHRRGRSGALHKFLERELPCKTAINDQLASGRPIGGTSAGLADSWTVCLRRNPVTRKTTRIFPPQQVLQNPYIASCRALVRDFPED